MQHRHAASAALALTFLSQAAAAQSFEYAPGTTTYRASIVTKMTNTVGGQALEDEMTQSQRLTVALSPLAGDTLALQVTIDSASAATRRFGAQNVAELVGLRVDGWISPDGTSHAGARASRNLGPQAAVLANDLARFLPRVRGELRPGNAWTDTTTEEIDMLGVPVRRQVVTTSRVVGDSMVAGERAWRIDRTAAVTFTGGGTIGGRTITLSGTSRTSGVIVVAAAGRYLGGDLTDSATTVFEAAGSGQRVAVDQVQRTRIEVAH